MQKAWWALTGTGIAAITVAIDFTIVNTSLANIERELHTSITQLQWVMAGFGLFFSTLLVTMGRLGDLRGHRKLLYSGVIGFGIASLGAGLSQSPQFLIAMRMLQGFFGSAIFPTGMAIVATAFPQNQQGRALSIYGSLIGVGLAFGPVIGSLIMTLLSWRWIFFINIPIIFLSLAICIPVIDESIQRNAQPIDWPGVITIIIALGTLVFAINQASSYGWLSTPIIICFAISLIALITFIKIERHTKAPLIPIQFFLNRGFLTGLIVYSVGVSIPWSIIFIMPLYLHTSLGLSTGAVGLLLFVMTIMTVIAPIISGHYYDRKGATALIHTIFIFSLASLFMFTQLRAHGPLWLIIISFILFGSAWGIGNGIAVPLSMSKLTSTENSGLVSGALITLMNLFAVIILTADTTLFDYGKKISFLHGVHIACALLMIISFALWIIATIVHHRK